MNNTRISILFIVLSLISNIDTSAQSKKAFFSIGSEKHYAEEFNYAYAKNNLKDDTKKDSLDAYLELYINFRLKVKEAKSLGYDTTAEFKKEFSQYRSQLEESYLSPKKEQEALVKEAYERKLSEIRASHILIRVSETASPGDTIKALKKITEIRNRIIQGEDFTEVAKIKSEDPSAKQNGGDLGYFSVFQMVYPFETAAYNTQVGQVSQPFRTQFGYHIIKVVDKRANEGKVQVAHIMIRSTVKNSEEEKAIAKEKALRIDSLLKAGNDWNELCKLYSEDQNSVAQNGALKPFGRGQIVPEFEEAAFNLTNVDDISPPIKTQFGWHIIKLFRKIPVASYEEDKESLGRRIKSDSRSSMPQKEMLKSLKEENNFKRNEDVALKLLQLPPSVIIEHAWQFDSAQLADRSTLFSIGEEIIRTNQFLLSINKSSLLQGENQKAVMKRELQAFEDSTIISYEKARLNTKYPEYGYLVNEYYDGILLFSIMEDSVWNRSMQDSVGLKSFYESNIESYSSVELDTLIFSSNTKSTLDSVALQLQNPLKTADWQVLNSKLLIDYNVSPLTLHAISKEDEEWSTIVLNNSTLNSAFENEGNWYLVNEVRVISYKPLKEIKGKVISDYQSYLDKKWIAKLRSKYSVKINKKQLNKVYAHFKATN